MTPRYTLALDLGTDCGFAIGDGQRLVYSGIVELQYHKTHGHPGDRLRKFYEFLADVMGEYPLSEIVYEAIKMGFHKGSNANALYFELQGILKLFSRQVKIHPVPYHTMTVKKIFTGSGAAKKEDVAEAAIQQGWKGALHTPGGKLINHDEADAVALLCVHMAHHGRPFSIAPIKDDHSEENSF